MEKLLESTPLAPAARLLLVEIIVVDRFHRAVLFPLVQGTLRRAGVHTRWIRFGLPANYRALSSAPSIELASEEQERLLQIVDEERPSHLLWNYPPASALAAELAKLGARVGVLADQGDFGRPADGICEWLRCDTGSVERFVLGKEAAALAVAPDFAWEPANPAAAAAQPLPFLICGAECTYSAPFARNPFFAGLDLSGCVRDGGCAFCMRPPNDPRPQADPLTAARLQLEALVATHPPHPRLAIRTVGEPFIQHVEELADLVLELRVPPSDFLLDSRSDRLVTRRAALDRALTKLDGTGHKLHICLLGIESFVTAELALLNKGTTHADNLAAALTLLEMEERHPSSFAFREHGGLSLVLFTPWTRLEDLALNLAIINRAGLSDLCGKVFTGRLRLYPSLPLYAAARRDGLLAPSPYSDALLDTARRNFYGDEVPWRCREPVVEAVSRVMLRLEHESTQEDDTIRRSLGLLMERVPEARDRMALAAAIVDAAIEDPSLREPLQLVTAAEPIVAGRTAPALDHEKEPSPAPHQAPPASERPAQRSQERGARPASPPLCEGVLRSDTVSHLLALEIGIKRVVRLEADNLKDLGMTREQLLRLAPVQRERRRRGGGREEVELFIGLDEAEVDEAVRLTTAMDEYASETDWALAAVRVGVLLGYPECCARRFAHLPPALRVSYTWVQVLNRLASPGRVSHLLNPAAANLVSFQPCSLECTAATAFATTLLAALRERHGTEHTARLEQSLRNPWLMLVDRQSAAVELQPQGEPCRRFRYTCDQRPAGDRLLQRVAEGDEMLVDDQQLVVLRRGRLHAALGGRAFLWWHERALQPELWQSILDLRLADAHSSHRHRALLQQLAEAAEKKPSEPQPPVALPPPTVSQRLGAVIQRVLDELGPRAFHGYRVVGLRTDHHTRLSLLLDGPDGPLHLLLAPRAGVKHAYLFAGPLAVMHGLDGAIDSDSKRLAIVELTRALVLGLCRQGSERRHGREC